MRPPSIPTTIAIGKDDSKSTIIMKSLYNMLIEHREDDRIMIQVFMCLPSRKDFPEYFSVIEKPIAMNKIRERIEKLQYADEQALMEDFKLMFDNCRTFNEDGSQIYRDATRLENLLNKKKEQLFIQHYGNSKGSSASNDSIKSTEQNNIPTKIESDSPRTRNGSNNNSSSNNNSIPQDIFIPQSQVESKNHYLGDQSNKMPQLADCGLEVAGEERLDLTHKEQTNGCNNDELEVSSLRVEHNHHNEASVDSSSNLSADLMASTPVEKCSLNTRRGRNSDAPKRQLLTGYIIYASEIRKQVIDKNPNQNFGDISRLVGNEWKALPHDIRSKYDQRALIHNKRVRERAQRDLATPEAARLSNGLLSPKLTKRKLAKLAKEKMRQHHLSIAGLEDDTSSMDCPTPGSALKQNSHQHSQPIPQAPTGKHSTTESSTQTTAIRFVEPPTKRRLVYSESFRQYIETLQIPNRDLLVEETVPERTPELPSNWLGSGIGRHESTEAALWALRDFMLQDAVTMRRSMEPYL